MNRKIGKSRPSLRWNRILLCCATAVLLSLLSVLYPHLGRNTVATEEPISLPTITCDDYFEQRQRWLSDHKRMRACFVQGETFYDILAGCGLSAESIMQIDEAAKPLFDFSRVKPGQIVNIWIDKESERVERISLHVSPDKILHVIGNGREFLSSLIAPPKISVASVTHGEVSSSFYESALEKGLSPDVIMTVADIFAWDIDFLADIRAGDSFQIILQRYYRGGKCIGLGNVLAIRFVNQNKIHESFYFVDSKGKEGYYNRNGESLRKALLKSPLRYRRISSYFSSRRFHPILKIYRPHYGIDYAAPVGTPVESVGDGRVAIIGWRGGYGRYIKIRHNSTYATGYGHLSRFAKGLKKGSRVRQGDVIGYVGASGLATGPHLDFTLMRKGRYANPLAVQTPPASRLKGKDRERFNKSVTHLEELWQERQPS